MKHTLALALSMLLIIVPVIGQADTASSIIHAQSTSNPLSSLNLGVSFFVQRSGSFTVVTAPITNLYKKGKLSFGVDGFTGWDLSNTKAVFGTSADLSYSLNPGLSAMIGLGVSVPYSDFTWSKINTNTIGLIVGFKGSF